jgi:23S rRNA (adenine2503-C2)-methyltransferase
LWTTTIARHQQDPDGTEKLLFTLADGQQIESVLLRDGIRRTICISTQVGCAMGCVFCASGLGGVERNLTTGEIVEQMLRLARLLPEEERLSHIVVMGMGEPLANVDNLLPALDMASSDEGLAISARRITISTVGLPPAIKRLARDKIPYHLAVSLHAADDELRNRLVKVNRNIGLTAILDAADQYFNATGRRITFEYVMLAGENDGREHATRLAKRLAGRNALVNLIPYNPVAGLPYGTPSRNAVYRFSSILTDAGINAQVRERKGSRIDAACGQLRRDTQQVVQIKS